jgi:hypothetical protein
MSPQPGASSPSTGAAPEDLPAPLSWLRFADQPAWEAWLEEHHASPAGVWLILAKRGATEVTVTQREAIETALGFGWIDGQVARIDQHFFRQRYTQRRPASRWSALNTRRVAALMGAGRIRPGGLARSSRPLPPIPGPGRLLRAQRAEPLRADLPVG